MEEADNILDLEGSRYILDGELVQGAAAGVEMRGAGDGDDDGLHRERVKYRVQDAADLDIVDKDVGHRGLGGIGNGHYREHEYGGPLRADAPRVELFGYCHLVHTGWRHWPVHPRDVNEIGKHCAHDVPSYLVCRPAGPWPPDSNSRMCRSDAERVQMVWRSDKVFRQDL